MMRPRRLIVAAVLVGAALAVPAQASHPARASRGATKIAPAPDTKDSSPAPVATPAPIAPAAAAPPAAPAAPATPAPPLATPASESAAETHPAPATEQAATRPSVPLFVNAGGTLLLGSLVLVALLYGATRLLRRLPIGRLLPSSEGPIRLVARTQLGTRESLCLVEVGPTTLLIALTAQSIQTLHVWPDGLGVAATPRSTATGPRPSVPGQLRELAARLSGTR